MEPCSEEVVLEQSLGMWRSLLQHIHDRLSGDSDRPFLQGSNRYHDLSLIGNYGVNTMDEESYKPHLSLCGQGIVPW